MVNALFSSRDGGTKDFVFDGIRFGWNAIVSLYERECDRLSTGLTRMVPKMKEVYVIRDAWTKLNVTPAKIMQIWNNCLYFYMKCISLFSKSTCYQNCISILTRIQIMMILAVSKIH